MKHVCLVTAFALLMLLSFAQDKGNRDLQKRIHETHPENAVHWIYKDMTAGFREARRNGRSLFITFHCVPCKDCMGCGGEVASGSG